MNGKTLSWITVNKKVILIIMIVCVSSLISVISVYQVYFLKAENVKLQNSNNDLRRDYLSLTVNYSNLDTEYSELQTKYSEAQSGFQEIQNNYTLLQNNCKAYRENYKTLEANYNSLQEDYSSLEKDYSSLNANYSNLQTEYSEIEMAFLEIQNNYTELTANYSMLEADYYSINTEYTTLMTMYDQLNTTYNDLIKDYDLLEQQLQYEIDVFNDQDYYNSIKNDLQKANESIYVAMYSMIYDPLDSFDWANDLVRELVNARDRGVNVSIIIENKTSFGSMNDNIEAYNFLLANSMTVQMDNENDTDHMKFVIIDDEIVYVGSHNWSESSLYHNHETSVRIVSDSIADIFEDYFSVITS
jgi:chromosome segregation ATPase